ncbi:hypothetical protein DXG03_007454 [Asterophora parasitica]|uniref:Uncharacterized protein n=1 Tax=Asterophora parasitica TaxID=117018 RepID=A0A9P7GCX8_9AGAR|nr:hypothetical protein DXG03_007454 [Asterophora parasitica]
MSSGSERSSESSETDSTFAITDVNLPPFNADDEKRVDLATKGLTPVWSFVTEATTDPVVEYVHLLPRNANDSLLCLMCRLECAWGIGPGTLHVDTSANVLPLAADMRKLLDQSWWLLLPEERILNVLEGKTGLSFFQMINEPTYKYTLVPFKDMADMTIHAMPTGSTAESTQLETHNYPFETLPTIVSHVHPCFVVCRAGRIYSQPDSLSFIIGYHSLLEIWRPLFYQSLQIYFAWVEQSVPRNSPFYRLPRTPVKELSVRNGVSEPTGRLDQVGYLDAVRQRKNHQALQKYLKRHSSSGSKISVQAWVESIESQAFARADNPA